MKNFGLGLLAGAVLGTVVAYLKNPNTGNTIKHDFKIQIDETIADKNSIQNGINDLNQNKDYLLNDGQKAVTDLAADIADRIDGFQNAIQPNINRINNKLADINNHLGQTSEID